MPMKLVNLLCWTMLKDIFWWFYQGFSKVYRPSKSSLAPGRGLSGRAPFWSTECAPATHQNEGGMGYPSADWYPAAVHSCTRGGFIFKFHEPEDRQAALIVGCAWRFNRMLSTRFEKPKSSNTTQKWGFFFLKQFLPHILWKLPMIDLFVFLWDALQWYNSNQLDFPIVTKPNTSLPWALRAQWRKRSVLNLETAP